MRLPVLGTTWYERGAAYWGRRAGLASVFVLAALFYAAIFWGFFRAARASGPVAFRAAVAVELVLVLSTAGYLLFHMFRRPPRPEDVALDRRRRSGPAAGAGVLARSLGPVGGIFVGAIALLTAGLLLAFLVFVLLPVWPVERTARQELAEALRARGYRLPER